MLLTKKLDTYHILFLLDGVTLENWYLPLQGQDAYWTYFPHLLLINFYKFYMLHILKEETHIYKWAVLHKEHKLQTGSCKNKVYFQTVSKP